MIIDVICWPMEIISPNLAIEFISTPRISGLKQELETLGTRLGSFGARSYIIVISCVTSSTFKGLFIVIHRVPCL
jgi:hypothetical protein